METSFASTARALAVQYPPAWTMPPDMQWFALPDRDIAQYFRLSQRVEWLQIERRIIADRLESIEDRTYYNLGDLGVWGLNEPSRFRLDRAEAYHRLWWIDMFIQVHVC